MPDKDTFDTWHVKAEKSHLVATHDLDARLFQLAQLNEIFFGNSLGILCTGDGVGDSGNNIRKQEHADV